MKEFLSRVNIITLYLEFNQMENILYTLALLFLWSCEQGLIPAFAYKCVLALRVFFISQKSRTFSKNTFKVNCEISRMLQKKKSERSGVERKGGEGEGEEGKEK